MADYNYYNGYGWQSPYGSTYSPQGTGPFGGLSSANQGSQALRYGQGYGQGNQFGAQLQGWRDSGIFDQLQQQFGGGGQNFLEQLKGSAPYQQLMGKGSQSFGDWYAPVKGQVDSLYAAPMAEAQKITQMANPSGMPVGSQQNYYAAAANPIQSQMAQMRQSMQQGARSGGNRSGMGMLSSYAPGVAGAGALGTAGAAASNMATRDEQQRGAANAQIRQSALNTWQGASGQKAQGLNASLGQYSGQQNMALQAAMSAIMRMLGLQAQQRPQFNFGLGPGGGQFSMSGYGGFGG